MAEEQLLKRLAEKGIIVIEKDFPGIYVMRRPPKDSEKAKGHPVITVIAKYYGWGHWVLSGSKINNINLGPRFLEKKTFESTRTSEIVIEINWYFDIFSGS